MKQNNFFGRWVLKLLIYHSSLVVVKCVFSLKKIKKLLNKFWIWKLFLSWWKKKLALIKVHYKQYLRCILIGITLLYLLAERWRGDGSNKMHQGGNYQDFLRGLSLNLRGLFPKIRNLTFAKEDHGFSVFKGYWKRVSIFAWNCSNEH